MTCVTRGPHEWDEPSIETEYEYVYIQQSCRCAEVTSAQTCDRLDETFYGYGAECDASRSITYVADDLCQVSIHGYAPLDWDGAEDLCLRLMGELNEVAVEKIASQCGWEFDDFPEQVFVEHDDPETGDTFCATFEKENCEVCD